MTDLWRRMLGLVSLLWREVAKFGTVGAAAFVVDSAVFWWLMHGPMEGSNVKAKIVAGAVATVFSWVANRYWTFRDKRQNNVVREAVMFVLMNIIGLGIQAGCVAIAQYGLGITDTTGLFIAGNVIGLFFGTVFRYFAYRFWVFKEELDAEPGYEDDMALLTGPLPVLHHGHPADDGAAVDHTAGRPGAPRDRG